MKDSIKVPGVARALVGFVSGRPWLSLLLGFAIMGAFLPGMAKIHADFTHRGFFYSTDPMLLEFDKFERQFGNDDAVVLAIHSPSGVFDVESAELIRTITEQMWKVPEVIRVDSLATYSWVHAEGDELIVEPFLPDEGPLGPKVLAERKAIALKHEVLPRYLVSDDAQTAMIFATVKPGIDAPPNAPVIIGAVRELVAKHQQGDHVFHISGGPAVTLGFQEAATADAGLLYPLAFGVTVLFLAVLLRSLIGIFLALLVVFPSIFASLGLMGLVGIQLTNITLIVPQILLAIGVADAVHILVTYFRTQRAGQDRKDAAEYALLKNFMPTFLTSLTTAVGFLSFASASLKPIVGLGILAGFGTIMAWLFTYLILGPLLFIIPLRRAALPPNKVTIAEERATRFTDWLTRNRTAFLAGFSVLCIVSAILAAQNTVNSDPFKYFREGFPLRVANDFIEDKVGGARGAELSISAGQEEGIKDPAFLKKVEAFQAWVEEQPLVTRAISIVDILKMTNRSLHGDDQQAFKLPTDRTTVAQELFLYQMSLPQGMNLNDRITIKNDAVRMTVLWTIKTSREVVDRIELMEEKGRSMGLKVVVTGKNRIWQSMNGYVVRSFIYSITIAVALISLILIIFFRSLSKNMNNCLIC